MRKYCGHRSGKTITGETGPAGLVDVSKEEEKLQMGQKILGWGIRRMAVSANSMKKKKKWNKFWW